VVGYVTTHVKKRNRNKPTAPVPTDRNPAGRWHTAIPGNHSRNCKKPLAPGAGHLNFPGLTPRPPTAHFGASAAGCFFASIRYRYEAPRLLSHPVHRRQPYVRERRCVYSAALSHFRRVAHMARPNKAKKAAPGTGAPIRPLTLPVATYLSAAKKSSKLTAPTRK